MEMKPCTLRKECEFCLKKYGRKLRAIQPHEKTPQYQAVSSFKQSRTCSDECRQKLLSKENYNRSEKQKAEKERAKEVHNRVYMKFCFGGKYATVEPAE
jgi:hypothetical protein